jgi:hypothetical protein
LSSPEISCHGLGYENTLKFISEENSFEVFLSLSDNYFFLNLITVTSKELLKEIAISFSVNNFKSLVSPSITILVSPALNDQFSVFV